MAPTQRLVQRRGRLTTTGTDTTPGSTTARRTPTAGPTTGAHRQRHLHRQRRQRRRHRRRLQVRRHQPDGVTTRPAGAPTTTAGTTPRSLDDDRHDATRGIDDCSPRHLQRPRRHRPDGQRHAAPTTPANVAAARLGSFKYDDTDRRRRRHARPGRRPQRLVQRRGRLDDYRHGRPRAESTPARRPPTAAPTAPARPSAAAAPTTPATPQRLPSRLLQVRRDRPERHDLAEPGCGHDGWYNPLSVRLQPAPIRRAASTPARRTTTAAPTAPARRQRHLHRQRRQHLGGCRVGFVEGPTRQHRELPGTAARLREAATTSGRSLLSRRALRRTQSPALTAVSSAATAAQWGRTR